MTVLSIIIGIIMIIGGFSCMFTPLLTYLSTEYFIVILVTVFGIFGIIKSIVEKWFGAGFFFSLLSVIFGIAVLCFPQIMMFADGILFYMVAAWFVLQGIINMITSITVARPAGSKMWILQLLIGILGILLGIYTFVHPAVVAVSLGLLIGFYFVETGFTLISASTLRRR